MRYGLEMAFNLVVRGEEMTPAELLEQIDRVTEEYAKLEVGDDRLVDVAFGANAKDMELEIELTVDAADPGDAAQLGWTTVRTAIHAAGGCTPNWEEGAPDVHILCYELDEQTVRPLLNA